MKPFSTSQQQSVAAAVAFSSGQHAAFAKASTQVLPMTGRGIELTTAQATVLAALLALFSAAIGGLIQGWSNINLEKQKFEFSVIQKTMELPDRGTQLKNLQFYAKTGYLSDPDHQIAQMKESELDAYLPSSTPTLLGGAASSITEWPWLVSVLSAGRFKCNGTLIAPRMVLTSAGCVASGQPSDYAVAPATDDGKYFRIGMQIPVSKIVAHPEFSKDDIVILELSIALPPPFATISAQRSADQKVGTLALIGTFDFRSELGKLTQTPTQIADDATYAQRFPTFHLGGSICAGFKGGGFSACPHSGSAGAPLVLFNGAIRKYQIGIVSLAEPCGPGALYGV